MGERRFVYTVKRKKELVGGADIIDGAQFASVNAAVEMREPAMKLTMVIESNQDPQFASRLIPLLADRSLDQIIEEPFVAERIPPLMERHQKSIEILRQRTECKEG